jgi:Mlc titration factor MtfA (ptsG expression regulator)
MTGGIAIIIIFTIIYYSLKNASKEGRLSGLQFEKDSFISYELGQNQSNAEYFAELVNTLRNHFPYYIKLNEEERRKFATRTFHIRKSKSFHGMENFVVTSLHETIISATLARLTYGLSKRYELPAFEMIQVYPAAFFSKLLNQHVKGLTLGNGRIFLSWQHFEEGMSKDNDKIHVGLHEFAHAMMIEFDHFEDLYQWTNWNKHATPIFTELRKVENHFFRKYGGTNMHEFWAVTIETFFEQPIEFRQKYPALYRATALMLNQDPCKRLEIFENI